MVNRRYSRLAQIEAKNAKRNTIRYGVLTVVLVIFGLSFGITIISKILSFASNISSSDQPVSISDTTPPAPPMFLDFPEHSNSEEFSLKGRAEPSSLVTLFFNGKEDGEVVANASGEFSSSYKLKAGDNTFRAVAKDTSGNVSNSSKTYTINLDTETPELSVTKPSDGQMFVGSTNKNLMVEGSVDSAIKVTVNDRVAVISASGKFSTTIPLSVGANDIVITASDEAGNETKQSISVTYSE